MRVRTANTCLRLITSWANQWVKTLVKLKAHQGQVTSKIFHYYCQRISYTTKGDEIHPPTDPHNQKQSQP